MKLMILAFAPGAALLVGLAVAVRGVDRSAPEREQVSTPAQIARTPPRQGAELSEPGPVLEQRNPANAGPGCLGCSDKDSRIEALSKQIEELQASVERVERDRDFYRSQLGETLACSFHEGVGRRFDADQQDLVVSYLIEPLGAIPEEWQLDQFLTRHAAFRAAMEGIHDEWVPMIHPASSQRFTEDDKDALAERRRVLIEGWKETLCSIFGPEEQQRIYP